MLLDILNIVGIAAFAASGALIGVRKRLDVFGVCVVGATTGIGGGLIRDVLLGIHPPTSMTYWPNIATAVAVSLLTFVAHSALGRLMPTVVVFDAFGLGLFAAGSAGIVLAHGGGTLAAVTIGATTAVGGGVLRDILVNEVPLLLHRDLYALPALLGAAIVPLADGAGARSEVGLIAGTVVATGLRLTALWRRWNLPQPAARE